MKEEDCTEEAGAADDALALQEVESHALDGKKKRQPRFRPVRRPGVLLDRPTDVGDTSRFLIFGGIVMVVVVLAGVGWLFSIGAPKPLQPPNAEVPAKSASNVASNTPEKAEPDYTLNASNRTCYLGVLQFFDFGRSEGLEWNSTQLLEKFNTSVPASSVNDPAVREIHAKTIELLHLGLLRPMQPHRDAYRKDPDLSKVRDMKLSNVATQHDAIMDRVKGLSAKLKRRYGLPPAELRKPSAVPADTSDLPVEARVPTLPAPDPKDLPPERPADPQTRDDLYLGR